MTHIYNPHRHVKIWLSKDPKSFLNLENQLRLIRMREVNKQDEINFIYDSRLLNPNAIAELQTFCMKHQITPKDVRSDVFTQELTAEEKNLITIYEAEINHINQGGNLAAASDILRWFAPIYKLGTYSDLDVHVDTSQMPQTMEIEQPIVFNLGSSDMGEGIECISLNTDTLAVVDEASALPCIKRIQNALYTNCKPHTDRNRSTPYLMTYQNHLDKYDEFFSQVFATYYKSNDPALIQLKHLSHMTKLDNSVIDVRDYIIRKTSDNNSFLSIAVIANQSREEKIAILREQINANLGFFAWLLTPSFIYAANKALAAIKDDEEFLTKRREATRMNLLKNSVMFTTGPGAVGLAVFDGSLLRTCRQIDQEVAPYSFAHYPALKGFASENSFPLHATSKEVMRILSNSEVGKTNDLSWLEQGQKGMVSREEKIVGATSKIQERYRATKGTLPFKFHYMKKQITLHIEKIEADLNGFFGFYRAHARREKIKALNAILGHFNEQTFNVKDFKAALKNYSSKDISASFGPSKTEELIKELTIFSRRACFFNLVDKQSGEIAVTPSPTPYLL